MSTQRPDAYPWTVGMDVAILLLSKVHSYAKITALTPTQIVLDKKSPNDLYRRRNGCKVGIGARFWHIRPLTKTEQERRQEDADRELLRRAADLPISTVRALLAMLDWQRWKEEAKRETDGHGK